MKVLVNYDKDTGSVMSDSGCHIGTWHGLETQAVDEKTLRKVGVPIETLVELKRAGFTAREIQDLHARGVI